MTTEELSKEKSDDQDKRILAFDEQTLVLAMKRLVTASGNRLTCREAEVATLVCSGMSNRQVAGEAEIAVKTVKFHLTSIFKKLNIGSRAEMMVIGLTDKINN